MGGKRIAAGMGAKGMGKQVGGARLAPLGIVATCAGRWAAAIVAGLAGAVAGLLARAAHT